LNFTNKIIVIVKIAQKRQEVPEDYCIMLLNSCIWLVLTIVSTASRREGRPNLWPSFPKAFDCCRHCYTIHGAIWTL